MNTDKYDGLEGSSSREIFFYFWLNIFYFSVNIFISRETIVISRDMFLFVAKRFSVCREIVFISRGARGFGRSFWRYVD